MSVDGVRRIPLRRFEDGRGWFCELRRDSALPKPTVQTNLSFSRKGVIRGLHFHERGQDDLFACLQGTARVVVLDRETEEVFSLDIGDDNPVAIYIPGLCAHGFDLVVGVVDRDDRRLVEDDAHAARKDAGVGGSKVDGQVVREERQRSEHEPS